MCEICRLYTQTQYISSVLCIIFVLFHSSFLSAESLKYSYLSFSPVGPQHVDLYDQYTEAHTTLFNRTSGPVGVGAVNSMLLHGDTAYVATTNGGIFRTDNFYGNATTTGPEWFPLTDDVGCNAVGGFGGAHGNEEAS